MKAVITLIFLGAFALTLIPLGGAQAMYYVEFDGVDGESSASSESSAGSVRSDTDAEARPTRASADGEAVACTADARQCPDGSYVGRVAPSCEFAECPSEETKERDTREQDSEDMPRDKEEGSREQEESDREQASGYIKIDDVKGESRENKGIEPDEIDISVDDSRRATNFAVLLGGGNDGGEEEPSEERRSEVAKNVLVGLRERGIPAEGMSYDSERIETKVSNRIRLFGFIPITTQATVEIDSNAEVSVRYPWWSFLASGKRKSELGTEVSTNLSAVLGEMNTDTE
ncbi:MAG: hypothetical protein WDZ88_00495 [Candidatus Paceibacterota bacterium]